MISPGVLSNVDEPIRELVRAINLLSGIRTIDSCCGHEKDPIWIFFWADSLEDLPPLLYWLDPCHSGIDGWEVTVGTDCAMSPITFLISSTTKGEEAYKEANRLAVIIEEYVSGEDLGG